jgi:hypothetical protein
VHAWLWWRRRGDPTNLALWCATVVYVLLLEPPLYFPEQFGLRDQVGLIFVHNLFSVQFLFDRLPLYIVALYPALTYLTYVLVQRTGVLDRRPALVGAACVAFVFHSFYEIFDHIGPQLRWWGWNPDAPSNEPWLSAVPLTSAVMFAGASPFGIALLTRWLIARRAALGPVPAWSMALRVVAVAVVALLRADPARRARGFLDAYPVAAGALYLVVFAVLWVTALPAYLDAVDGVTGDGTPIGSAPYAAACAVVCLWVLWLAAGRSGRREEAEEPELLGAER